MKTLKSYLGIDVSKKTLHLGNSKKFLRAFENSTAGRLELIDRIRQEGLTRVVLEASGGYERSVVEMLQDAGIDVTVAQPSCIRHFAKSTRVLAKTDEIDARLIARFAEATQPEPTPPAPENTRKLRALSDRRQQIVEDRVREQNRLEACVDPAIRQLIENSIEQLKAAESALDRQITQLLCTDQELSQKSRRLQEQVGVGEKTAATLLSCFPELGTLTRQQAAALAGLAPYASESGKWKGKRRIFGGRAMVRKAMYMAAKTAARCCPVVSEFYKRLRDSGKTYNQALIACARKLLVRLNTVLKLLADTVETTDTQRNPQNLTPNPPTPT